MNNCNPKHNKANDPDYICNPKTGRWVKKTGDIGKALLSTSIIDIPIVVRSKSKIPLIMKTEASITASPQGLNFKKYESIYYSIENKITNKLAIFDLDGTLIQPSSGQKFSSSSTDWEFAFPNVPEVLKGYFSDGYSLIIISNQAGLSAGKISLDSLIDKLKSIYSILNLPIQIYFSTEKDSFRKPMTDIWDFMIAQNHIKPSLTNCFYCGDAAGRLKGYLPNKPKDFNITDRYFAHNLKIKFFTPEEIFIKSQPFPYYDLYEKELVLTQYYPTDHFPIFLSLSETDKNLIIMIGPQASGKSTLSKMPMYSDYKYLNNDTIKNKQKLQKMFISAAQNGENIIIDNTNPEKETRKFYIDIAKNKGYKIYCYFFDFPKILSFHLNQMRVQLSHSKIKSIPSIAIHTYYKNLQKPKHEEGFDDIIVINKLHTPIGKNINIDDFTQYFYYKYDI